MRQPSNTRRYADYSHAPRSSGGQRNPDIVVSGRTNDSDSVGQREVVTQVLENNSTGKLGGVAANPNRADIPSTKRKGSYDAVSC